MVLEKIIKSNDSKEETMKLESLCHHKRWLSHYEKDCVLKSG